MSTKAGKKRGKSIPGQTRQARGRPSQGARPRTPPAPKRKPTASRTRLVWTAAVFAGAIVVLLGIFLAAGGNGSKHQTSSAGAYRFQVGQPGPGRTAPDIQLASTDGTTFDLAALRGEQVLLYFQEGIGCQPCWDQIKDIEKDPRGFRALGINRVVSITTNPLDALRQKATDEGIKTPVLADPTLRVSRAYHANDYGMMGDTTDGHSFVLVDPQGMIVWRADYGGEPDFTMYVPPSNVVADLRKALSTAGTLGT